MLAPSVTPYTEDSALDAADDGLTVAILCRSPRQAHEILTDLACAVDAVRVWTMPAYRRIDVPGGGSIRVYDPTQQPHHDCSVHLTA